MVSSLTKHTSTHIILEKATVTNICKRKVKERNNVSDELLVGL